MPTNVDEALCNKLLNFPSPKASLERICIKSTYMEQMLFLGNMDPCRLKGKPENKNDCHARECKHFGMLMKFQWKVRVTYKKKPGGGGGSYHDTHASRHLENHCNEVGNNSIQECLIEKCKKINMKKMLQ